MAYLPCNCKPHQYTKGVLLVEELFTATVCSRLSLSRLISRETIALRLTFLVTLVMYCQHFCICLYIFFVVEAASATKIPYFDFLLTQQLKFIVIISISVSNLNSGTFLSAASSSTPMLEKVDFLKLQNGRYINRSTCI